MIVNNNVVKNHFEKPIYFNSSGFNIEVRSAIVKEILRDKSVNAKILDIGCGDGSLSISFLNVCESLTLLDFSSNMIERATNNVPKEHIEKVTPVNCSIDEFTMELKFDVILCVGVLAHVPSIDNVISKITKILNKGGVVIFELTPKKSIFEIILWPYYYYRKVKTGNPKGYELNKISIDDLIRLCRRNELNVAKHIRHSYPLPTQRNWPLKWQRSWTYHTWKSRFFSNIGLEHIIMFTSSNGK